MSESWDDPIYINDTGSRCVVNTNWGGPRGDRAQMIWERQPGGGCVITTCRKDVPPLQLNAEQVTGLAYFLRQV